MQQVTFRWSRDWITPRLLTAVGSVVLEWAMLDHEVTAMCERFWFKDFPGQGIHRAFDRRADALLERAKKLYSDEPDEYRTFAWYMQRLRTLNGRRDDLAHGTPGQFSKDAITYHECLMVPFPSRPTKYERMTVEDVEKLASDLAAIFRESGLVSWAFTEALNASSGNISNWREPDGWTQLTMANRSPKLPRDNPPPSTFRA